MCREHGDERGVDEKMGSATGTAMASDTGGPWVTNRRETLWSDGI